MAETPVETNTVFIDVGKGPEPFTVVTDRRQEGNLIPTVLPDLQPVKILQVLPRGRKGRGHGEDSASVERVVQSPNVPRPSKPAQPATKATSVVATTEHQKSYISSQRQRIKCPEQPATEATGVLATTEHQKSYINSQTEPIKCPEQPATEPTSVLATTIQKTSCITKRIPRIKCPECPRYLSKNSIQKHLELIHHTDNPFRCPECPFIGKHKPDLNKHLKGNHGPDMPTKVFVCKPCNFTTKIRKRWHAHNWYHHKLLKCKTKKCTFRTTRASKYDEHVKNCNPTDLLEKPPAFQCRICSWSSEQHVRILLHLIHHPNQEVDESVLDISVLRKHGIR